MTPPMTKPPRQDAVVAGPTPRWRRIFGRLRPVLIVATVAAVVAVIVLLARPVTLDTPNSPGVVELTPATDGLGCVRDATWSPDGRSIALLGYSGSCTPLASSAPQSAGRIQVYDASTGAIRARYTPDGAILNALRTTLPSASQPVVRLQSILWRSDGSQLAVAFSVTSASQTGTNQTTLGVYVTGTGSGGAAPATVFTHVLAPGENAAGTWNLRTGAYLDHPPAGGQASETYRWSAAGALLPGAPLGTAPAPEASQPASIGTTSGDAAFSMWQPAQLVRESTATAANAAPSDAQAVDVYRTSFASWSPDGTYFVPSMGVVARVQPNGHAAPDRQTLQALGMSSLPVVRPRDAALSVALDRLALVSPDQSNGPMLVAWSPDGHMLAVQLVPAEPNASPSRTDHALILYDCATGKALTALAPRVAKRRLAGDNLLRWSPDSTHLMLYDATLGTVMLWGPAALPHG